MALLLAWVALLASACTATAPSHSRAPRANATVPTVRVTTRVAPITTVPAPVDLLSGFGATEAEWAAGHTVDPNGTGYWPRLANGLDTYTSVRFIRGRALRYTENLYPPLPAASALHVIGDELPPDAHVVHDAPSPPAHPSCAQVVEASPTLQATAGMEVLAELRSSGGRYDSAAVASITYQALTGSSQALPAC